MDSTLLRTLSWEDLYQEVRKLAHVFKGLGIGPGDRVAAFSPSNAEAVIAALACTALGGIWTSTPSEFGVNAVLERLTQIEPTVLLTADEFRYNGKTLPIDEKLEAILEQLPTVKHVIVVGQLQTDRKSRKPFPSDLKGRSWYHYVDLLATGEKAQKEIQVNQGMIVDTGLADRRPRSSIVALLWTQSGCCTPRVRLASRKLSYTVLAGWC